MNTTIGFPVITMVVFSAFVIAGILIDLFYHRSDKVISLKDATIWTIFWVLLACVFGVFLYFNHGSETAGLFFTGYVLEKALSVDNLFVFMAIFGAAGFAIPENLRHRVLYWGIIGAIIFRMIFVFIGTSLMSLNGWVELLFGLIVGYTAWLMLKKDDDQEVEEDYKNHVVCRFMNRYFPVTADLYGNKFFVKREVKFFVKREVVGIDSDHFDVKKVWVATPLFVCLAVVEMSDVMFAFDSVPAVIAVSKDPLIVYSAMIFAILGLRTMYFMLEAAKNYFEYLEKAVIMVLAFIAVKLISNSVYVMTGYGFHIDYLISLTVILTLLTGSILLSLIKVKFVIK